MSGDTYYEQHEIGRVLDSGADFFALKIESRDDEASSIATRWITVDRSTVEAILAVFEARS